MEYVIYFEILKPNNVWVREKNEFLSKVDKEKYPKVDKEFRFTEISKTKEK